jgi:DNA ligase (NAD+)
MSASSLRKEVEAGRRRLRAALLAYYAEAEPLCSDAEYDALAARVAELEAREPHLRDWDSPTTRVQPPALDAFPTREHRVPMLSLSNVYSIEELREWEASLLRLLPDAKPVYLAELKVDGLAIALHYEQGRLVAAVTRGDGTLGEDVTRNIKTIRNLPHRLPKPLTLEVRGEVYYGVADFAKVNQARERLGEPTFKNPRNAAAGTLRMLDTTQVGERRLNVAVYALVGESPKATDYETLRWLASLGLPISAPLQRLKSVDAVAELYADTLARRHTLPFQIDGLVVKVDSLALRERAGFTSKSPRWATALKFGAEQATTTLEDVVPQVGRTGVLTPVAHLAPVELGGTTVSRATLHNYDQIERLDLRLGDRVVLEKGGDIIPKVVAVDTAARKGARRRIKPPKACPSCGSVPERLEDEVDYHCLNPACPAQRAERIRHFVARTAMDIESVGPALIDQLLDKGLVETYADLYTLSVATLEPLERMGRKSAENVVNAIEASKRRPLEKFLHGLGIRYVGERTARVLALHFGSIPALEAASVEDFENVNEIGAVTAKSLHTFFQDRQQMALVQRCLEQGVAPQAPQRAGGADAPLAGKTVVITGTLGEPRTVWKERLERAGATVTGSVSAKTHLLLAGESPGSKLDAARKHGVQVLDEAQMRTLLEKR